MRQVYIDVTSRNTRSSTGDFVGYLGEHNATELLISIPQAMVDESDYQVVVFQSGPMVFKTRKITEDKTKPTYRDGNTIHTKLTRSLTKVSPLGLQVECYKENENGDAVLVGKTQTVPHLVLKPSPEGFPGFGYDGAFEDIENAVHNAHKHNNLDVLAGFSVNEKGDVYYNDKPIEGIAKYKNPSALPKDASMGTIALALEDDEPEGEPEPIVCGKQYRLLKLKSNIDLDDFSKVAEITSDAQVALALRNAKDTVASLIMIHMPVYDMSILALMDAGNLRSVRMWYEEDAMDYESSSETMMLFFNPYREFDFSVISGSGAKGVMVPLGWSFVNGIKANPRIDEYMNISYDDSLLIRQQERFIKNYQLPYENVSVVPDSGSSYNMEVLNELLPKILEEVPDTRTKGLYIFTDNGWLSIADAVKTKSVFASTVADLPLDAPEGMVAFVVNNTNLFQERHFNIFKNNTYEKFYLAPRYNDFALLYDFTLVIEMWRHIDTNNSEAKYGDGIAITTNKDQKYFVLEAHSTKYPYNRHLIYSWEDQTITYSENKTFEVKEGWNELTPYYAPDTVRQLSFDELPEFDCEHSGSYATPYYKVISLNAPDYGGERDYLPMYHFSDDPYNFVDKGRGLWIKGPSDWMKHTDNNEYLSEED